MKDTNTTCNAGNIGTKDTHSINDKSNALSDFLRVITVLSGAAACLLIFSEPLETSNTWYTDFLLTKISGAALAWIAWRCDCRRKEGQ